VNSWLPSRDHEFIIQFNGTQHLCNFDCGNSVAYDDFETSTAGLPTCDTSCNCRRPVLNPTCIRRQVHSTSAWFWLTSPRRTRTSPTRNQRRIPNSPQQRTNRTRGTYTTEVVRYTAGPRISRCFSVSGPTVWNSLPDYLRDPGHYHSVYVGAI